MARVFTEFLQGDADGTAISSSNSAYTSTNGSPAFEQDPPGPLFGGGAILASGVQQLWIGTAYPQPASYYRRFYLYITASPSANVALLNTTNAAASTVSDVRITTSRTVQIRRPTTARAESTEALPIDQWVRFEVRYTSGSGVEVRAWWGANLHAPIGTTPDLSVSNNSALYPDAEATALGRTNSVTGITLYLAADAMDGATWVGPAYHAATLAATGGGTATASATVTSGAATVTGTAQASGGGSATATATVTHSATAQGAGTGTATAGATVTRLASAQATGGGAGAASATVTRYGTAQAAGGGTATAAATVTAPTVTVTATASASGGGSASASATRTVHGTATATGSGTGTASLLRTTHATAAASGGGTATATADRTTYAYATGTGSGTATVHAVRVLTATATATGGGTATATALVRIDTPPTPTTRRLTVDAESRTLDIPLEPRSLTIPPEPRRLTIR